jgi:hypothetical protein
MAFRMKRKYTVSDKVLAANRRNLEKANAVPKSIRYRATARRLASCHANLQKAQAAQPDPQHPRRRGQMGHGFRVVDLRRTAPQAGERLEDLDRHRALFLKTFGGSRDQCRLARAMADIFWRRWRALGWEAECEAKQFYGRLAQDPNPLPGSALRPACRQGRPRAYALRPIAFRRQAGRRAELQTSRALDCLVILGGLVELDEPLGKLSRRFERLARAWLCLHTGEYPSDPNLRQARISRFDIECLKQSEAALSTPFLSSGQVARRLEQGQKPLRPLDPPEQWRPWGSGARGRDCNLSPVTCDLALELPADFEAHRQRLEAAFGGSAELSSNSAAFLERAAQLSWQRLKLIAEQLEKEKKAVAQLFKAKLDPAALLARLVALLAKGGALLQKAHALKRKLQQALHEWLTQQEPEESFEALRPGRMPATLDSTLAELDRLEKELGLQDKWEPEDRWERDEEAWERG